MNLLLNIGDKNYSAAHNYHQFVLSLFLKNKKLLSIDKIYLLNDAPIEAENDQGTVIFIHQPVYTKSNWIRKKWQLFWEAKKINALDIDCVLNIEKPFNKWIKQPQYLFLNEFSFLKSNLKEKPFQSLMGFKKIFTSTIIAQDILHEHFIHFTQVLVPFLAIQSNHEKDNTLHAEVETNYFLTMPTQSFEKEGRRLLKAFSMFKKWQLSHMKYFIIVSKQDYAEWQKQIELYKYKTDIVFIVKESLDAETLHKYISAAYALVHLTPNESFPFALLSYFSFETPIIAVESTVNKNVFKESIAWAEEDTEAEIAELMVYVYKNETFRNQLIPKMKKILRAYAYPHLLPEYKSLLIENFK